jgi:hypothetical protein
MNRIRTILRGSASPVLVLLASVALIAFPSRRAAGASPPNLVGIYNGSYHIDGTMNDEPFRFEFERQRGRKVNVSVFAENQPEFLGKGTIAPNNTHLTMKTASAGRRRNRWHLVMKNATILDGGNSIEGVFSLKKPAPLTSLTGTFTVSR